MCAKFSLHEAPAAQSTPEASANIQEEMSFFLNVFNHRAVSILLFTLCQQFII